MNTSVQSDSPAAAVVTSRTSDRTVGRGTRSRPAPANEGRSLVKYVGRTVVWAFTVINVFLLFWLVSASFKTPRELNEGPLSLPRFLFEEGRPFRNWATAWQVSGFKSAFGNTVIVVFVSSLLILAIGAPAAYALSRAKVRWARPMTGYFVLGMGVPFQTLVIPLSVAMSKVSFAGGTLNNSLTGLIIVYTALSLPFTIYLLTGFFASLPDELEEAAAMDGATGLRTFVGVMLPLARGGLLTAFIINAIGLWNETLLAVVLVRDDSKYTMARELWAFDGTMQYNSDYGALLAGVALLVLPMFILYLVLARYIIGGLTLGSGK